VLTRLVFLQDFCQLYGHIWRVYSSGQLKMWDICSTATQRQSFPLYLSSLIYRWLARTSHRPISREQSGFRLPHKSKSKSLGRKCGTFTALHMSRVGHSYIYTHTVYHCIFGKFSAKKKRTYTVYIILRSFYICHWSTTVLRKGRANEAFPALHFVPLIH